MHPILCQENPFWREGRQTLGEVDDGLSPPSPRTLAGEVDHRFEVRGLFRVEVLRGLEDEISCSCECIIALSHEAPVLGAARVVNRLAKIFGCM